MEQTTQALPAHPRADMRAILKDALPLLKTMGPFTDPTGMAAELKTRSTS